MTKKLCKIREKAPEIKTFLKLFKDHSTYMTYTLKFYSTGNLESRARLALANLLMAV